MSRDGWLFGGAMLPIFGYTAGRSSSKFSFLIHFVQLLTNGVSIFKTIPLYNKRYAVKNINLKSGRTSHDFGLFLGHNTSHRRSENTYFYELLSKSK